MRNISFALTKEQIRIRTKTETRRFSWRNLEPRETLCGVEKGRGLRAGEKVVRLCAIRVVDVRFGALRRMSDDLDYGFEESQKEGFATDPSLHLPSAFVNFFCRSHKNFTPETQITRIEFEYPN